MMKTKLHTIFQNLTMTMKPSISKPHRDRQPEDASSSFHDDEQPKFVTQWIALSDATTENSCLHVIPKHCDPGYMDGDNDTEDPLRRALPDKQSFQNIRALPRSSGQSVLFTHRIIHWGSRSDADTTHPPRIAISFVSSDPDFEPPLINPESFSESTNPPFRIRLLLVCAQLLIYYQRFELSKEAIKTCYEFCKSNENDLEEGYRRKVFLEFINAMKETTQKSDAGKKDTSVKLIVTEEDGEEDEEDAMMKEMLDAEAGGYGEFEDDFDDINDDEDDDGDIDDEVNDRRGGEDDGFDENDEDEDDEDLHGEVNLFQKRGRDSTESGSSSKPKKAPKL